MYLPNCSAGTEGEIEIVTEIATGTGGGEMMIAEETDTNTGTGAETLVAGSVVVALVPSNLT